MGDESAPEPDNQASFAKRLADARRRAGLDRPDDRHSGAATDDGRSSFSLAMRLGAEMVASLVVAVAIGYGLDRLFGSAPWFMIGFVPIGAAAGLRNVIRAMGPKQKD